MNKARRNELSKLIEEHAPEGAQKNTFRDFIVHAAADMLWPPALKSRVHRHLRHNGPQMYGFRASGQIEARGLIYLAHYAENPKRGVRLYLRGDAASVEVEAEAPVAETHRTNSYIDIHFEHPVSAAQTRRLALVTEAEDESVFLLRAEWIT